MMTKDVHITHTYYTTTLDNITKCISSSLGNDYCKYIYINGLVYKHALYNKNFQKSNCIITTT